MAKLKHFLIAIIIFNSSFTSLAQLDSVFHQGPSIGSVTSGALQTTDNFGNQPILNGEPKIIPNPESPYSEPLIVPTDKSSLPPYIYVEDTNVGINPRVGDGQTVILQKFQGIPMTNIVPPDPIIAAGPNHIVACVNSQFSIWDKEGNLLKVIPANDWWAPVWPDEAGDPQVIYDHYEGRWFLCWMQVNDSNQTAGNLIAYSDDDDPLGTWYVYRLDTKMHGTVNSNTWGDLPQLGFDDEAIYIATRCFGFASGYYYNKIRIINKAELYASNGGVLAYTDFWNIRQSSSPSSLALDGIHPSYCYTTGQGGYFFWASRNGGNYYVLNRVLDPISTTPRLRGKIIPVQYYYNTPNANQLGGGLPIESNGSSVKTAPIVRDGKMYITHSIRNSTSPAYASAKYIIYDVTSNLITEQAELGAIEYYYIFPTIAIDKDHNIAVTYSRSANSEYIGGYYSTKHSGDPPGLSPSQPLAEGQGNYVVTLGGTRNRWGDYLGIFLDPNEYDVWIFPEYAAATNTWGTYVGQIRMASYTGPHIYANPLEIDFGDVEVGQSSATYSTIISNYGDTDVIISDIPYSVGDFNVLTTLTFPYTLSSYDSLILEFNFTPTDTGRANVIYSLISNDPNFAGFTFNGNGTFTISSHKFTFEAQNTFLSDTVGSEMIFDIDVQNISTEELTLYFKRTINDLPTNWTSSLAFGINVFAPFIDSVVTNANFFSSPLAPGESREWAVHVFALQNPGVANIRVVAGDFNNPSDSISIDLVAAVSDTSLVLDIPNGGENWQVGTNQSIVWNSSNVGLMNIDYTTNNGSSWLNIVNDYDAGIGSYSWTIPNTPSIQCKVKITDNANSNISDQSNSVFTIESLPEPELSLLYPNGGEQFAPNDTVHIQWHHSLINFITLEFSDDNGATWSDIDMGFPADSNLYIWTIEPGVSSTQCLIKICDFENSQFCDESNDVFTITPPSSITVLIPNGGEVWLQGTTEDITWTSENVIDVKIELSLNNGASWSTIIDSILSNGIYSWLVNPPQPSTQSLIRISDVSDETIVDQSDDVFTIDIASGVEDEFSGIPDSYKLLQNYPNPFNPSTTIYYGLPEESSLKITIYDVLGNEVMIYSEEKQEAGYHRLEFNATDSPSGVYFYRLEAGDYVETKKMVLMK